MTLSPITHIIEELKAGRMVILVDEEDRENEGDLVMAADFVTPDAINFMARYGRGLICLTLTEERCRQLNLPLMVSSNRAPMGTNFTVSIEAASGVTTGISAADRARTIQAAVARDAKPEDIVQPGHIFPVMAQKGGVLVRAGHTEAGCDLAQLAGLTPASVICEILKENGEMARLPDLLVFAEEHGIRIGAIADLIHYRNQTESLVSREAERPIRTLHGDFRLVVYLDRNSNQSHLALVKGEIDPGKEIHVRVHEPISVMDLLDIENSAHSWKLNDALKAISECGSGVIVLLGRKECDGDMLDRAMNTAKRVESKVDLRNYGIGAQILRDLGVKKMRLLGLPRKMPSMTGFDLEVTGFVESIDEMGRK